MINGTAITDALGTTTGEVVFYSGQYAYDYGRSFNMSDAERKEHWQRSFVSDLSDMLSDDDYTLSLSNLNTPSPAGKRTLWDVAAEALNLPVGSPDAPYGEPLIMVPLTGYGDYSGSTLERSNHRALLADSTLRPWLRVVTGDFSYTGLFVPLRLVMAPGDCNTIEHNEMVAYLAELLGGLADYPLVDDSDHSQLEMDLITEALPTLADDTEMDFYHGRGAAESLSEDDREAVTDEWPAAEIATAFVGSWVDYATAKGTAYPECEDAAGSVAWHGIDDTLTAHIVEVWQHTGQLPAPMRAVQP